MKIPNPQHALDRAAILTAIKNGWSHNHMIAEHSGVKKSLNRRLDELQAAGEIRNPMKGVWVIADGKRDTEKLPRKGKVVAIAAMPLVNA